ncbi:hypothetical protein [Pseudomonas sp. Marseille-QA0892]
MPKHRGRALRIEPIALATCTVCGGEGVVRGIFHEFPCDACNGSGVVGKEGAEKLSAEVLVQQLRLRLRQATRQIERQAELLREAGLNDGAARDYVGSSNRHHRGGGNWTGD